MIRWLIVGACVYAGGVSGGAMGAFFGCLVGNAIAYGVSG